MERFRVVVGGGKGTDLVTGETPQLSRSRGDFSDGGRGEGDDDNGRHDTGAGIGLRDVEEHLNEGVTRWGGENFLHVAHGEGERDGHQKTHERIEAEGSQERLGQGRARVFDFLAHMDRAIEADRGDDGTEQADHRGGAVRVPASSVGKLGPHGLRISRGSEGPERDKDGDHSEDVEDQQQPFHQG